MAKTKKSLGIRGHRRPARALGLIILNENQRSLFREYSTAAHIVRDQSRLHGYPETHMAWHRLVPVLAQRYTVVATDLCGYGESRGPINGPASDYSKRTMASDQIAVMDQLGFDRFGDISLV